MEDFEVDSTGALSAADLVLLMTSTYGHGAPPGSATKFLAWLKQVAAGPTEANVLHGEGQLAGCVDPTGGLLVP